MSQLFRVLPLGALALLLITVAGCNPGSETPQSNNNANSAPTTGSASPAASPATDGPRAKLNINTASGSELLAAIPNLGNRMLHEFEEYRPYRSVQQFRREIGKYVSPDQVAEYEKYIFVPINPNESDAQTLQQIPGLEEKEAQAMIAGRPYGSAEDFLAKLADKVSPTELAIARTYVQ